MKKFFIYLTSIYLFITYKTTKAYQIKYEPPFSYGIIGGVSYFFHPFTNDGLKTKEENIYPTKSESFFPSIGLFANYRFYNQIFGSGVIVHYTNRRFGDCEEITRKAEHTNINCIDGALVFCVLPKGYGGVNIYIGPKIYYIINANTKTYDFLGNKIGGNKDIISSINKKNLGILIGFNLEIDRLGLLLGAEYEHFFFTINKTELVPQNKFLYEKYLHISYKNKWRSGGFRIYIGYDFGRLHSSY